MKDVVDQVKNITGKPQAQVPKGIIIRSVDKSNSEITLNGDILKFNYQSNKTTTIETTEAKIHLSTATDAATIKRFSDILTDWIGRIREEKIAQESDKLSRESYKLSIESELELATKDKNKYDLIGFYEKKINENIEFIDKASKQLAVCEFTLRHLQEIKPIVDRISNVSHYDYNIPKFPDYTTVRSLLSNGINGFYQSYSVDSQGSSTIKLEMKKYRRITEMLPLN